MAISFAVSSWSGWTSPAAAESQALADVVTVSQSPDVSAIPPLLRRRLNFMGRACASEVLRHMSEGENTPMVYCSRHGDIERTLGVLKELAKGEPMSPMDFSLTVHNAIAGVISIHRKIRSNISSIAAGEDALVPVLLEAAGLLTPDCPKVLCVLCDVTLPEIYQSADEAPQPPYVACFQVTRNEGMALRLESPPATPSGGAEPQCLPLEFIDFLSSSGATFTASHNGECWVIHKANHNTR